MASRIKREAERNIRSNDFLQENKSDFTENAYATSQIVRKRYRNDPAKLAAWIFASRVQRDAQPRPSGSNPPANSTT